MMKINKFIKKLREIEKKYPDIQICVNSVWDAEVAEPLKQVKVEQDETKVWCGDEYFIRLENY